MCQYGKGGGLPPTSEHGILDDPRERVDSDEAPERKCGRRCRHHAVAESTSHCIGQSLHRSLPGLSVRHQARDACRLRKGG